MHDSPIERPPVNTMRSSSQFKSSGRDQVPFSGRDLVIQLFRQGQLNDAIVELDNLLAKTDEMLGVHHDNANVTEDSMVEKIWELCMMSAVRLRRIYEGRASQFADDELRDEEVTSSRFFIREAEGVAVDVHSTRGYWCLAVGLLIASGGHYSNGCEDRMDWLEKSQVYLEEARSIYTNSLSSNSSSSSSSLSRDAESRIAAFNKKIDSLQRDIIAAMRREETDSDDSQGDASSETNVDRWKWLDTMYMQQIDDDIQPSKSRQSTESPGNDGVDGASDAAAEHSIRSTSTSRHATIASSASERPASDSDTSNMDVEISNENDESNSDTQHSDSSTVVTSNTHDQHESSSDTSDSEDDSDISMDENTDEDISEDDEYEESNPYYDEDDHDDESDDDDDATSVRSISELEPDVDLVTSRKKYVGHCNVRVSYWGSY